MQSTASLSRNTTFTFGTLSEKSAEFSLEKKAPISSGDAPSTTTSKRSCGKLAHSAMDFGQKSAGFHWNFRCGQRRNFHWDRWIWRFRARHLAHSCSFPRWQTTSRCNYKNRCSFHVLFCPHLSPGFGLFEVRGVVVWPWNHFKASQAHFPRFRVSIFRVLLHGISSDPCLSVSFLPGDLDLNF